MRQGIKHASIGLDVLGHLMEIQNLIQPCATLGNYLFSSVSLLQKKKKRFTWVLKALKIYDQNISSRTGYSLFYALAEEKQGASRDLKSTAR